MFWDAFREHKSSHNLPSSEPKDTVAKSHFRGKYPGKKNVKSPKYLGINTNASCMNVSSRKSKYHALFSKFPFWKRFCHSVRLVMLSYHCLCFHWCCLHQWSWIGMWWLKVAYESNLSRLLEFVELIITSETYKICDSMRLAMLLFFIPPLSPSV